MAEEEGWVWVSPDPVLRFPGRGETKTFSPLWNFKIIFSDKK
jgi:hypothetical protein